MLCLLCLICLFIFVALKIKEMDKITVNQTAEILGVSVYTVRRYIKEKRLQAEKKQTGLKYILLLDRSEVEQFKDSLKK